MKKTRTISITSGKGGVGKTTISTNMAYELARRGNKVLVFDGDIGMANADILFGVRAQHNILDVIQGRCEIEDVLLNVEPNLDLIPGGSGVYDFNKMSSFEKRALLDSVECLNGEYDYFIVDTAPGIADHVLYLNAAAEIPMVVITPDPSSITDAYALIKVLNKIHKTERVAIICNQVKDEDEGLNLFKKFNDVVHRFLYVGLDYAGSIPTDSLLKKANLNQRLILKQNPEAPSSLAISHIANSVLGHRVAISSTSGLQFFWEHLVGVA